MDSWTIVRILFFATGSLKIFTLLRGNELLPRIPIVELLLSRHMIPFGMIFGVEMISNRGFICNLDIVARATVRLFFGMAVEYTLLLAGYQSKMLAYGVFAAGCFSYSYIAYKLRQPDYEEAVPVPDVPAAPPIRHESAEVAQHQGHGVLTARLLQAFKEIEEAAKQERIRASSAPPAVARPRSPRSE